MEITIVTGTGASYRDAPGVAASTFGSALRPRLRGATAEAFGGSRPFVATEASATPTPAPALDTTAPGTS